MGRVGGKTRRRGKKGKVEKFNGIGYVKRCEGD